MKGDEKKGGKKKERGWMRVKDDGRINTREGKTNLEEARR